MSSYVASQAAANTTTSIASSSFLEKNGNIVGFILSFIYIVVGSIVIFSMLKNKDKKKSEYIFIPVVFILLAIIDFIYYYFSKDSLDQNTLNSYVGNISLIPLYFLILALFFIVISQNRF